MNASADPIRCDVLVAGGGPAGSTVATLLARRGRSVLLAEKDAHPRFHIGESLLPMNLPLFEQLGVLDAVARIGVRKPGADFPADNERGYNTFSFARTLTPAPDHAFQVQRSELDALLFRTAREAGVDARERVRVTAVEPIADGVRAMLRAGDETTPVAARYFVDATGRDTLLGDAFRLKRRHRRHQSAALFAHFRGVERRPGPDAGNISIYRFEHGWVWMIPLPEDVTSVGAVCRPAYLRQRRGRAPLEFLTETLAGIPAVAARLRAATPVGHHHATGNYGYECARLAGPRWILIGDACAFVDPIFSSGVLLAMHSAARAASLVDAVLDDPRRERALQRAYTRTTRRGLATFSWFIERFTTPAMKQLFARPKNPFGVEQALISMLAGDVFDNAPVRRRLWVFKALYHLAALSRARESLRAWRDRRAQVTVRFEGGTTAQDHA